MSREKKQNNFMSFASSMKLAFVKNIFSVHEYSDFWYHLVWIWWFVVSDHYQVAWKEKKQEREKRREKYLILLGNSSQLLKNVTFEIVKSTDLDETTLISIFLSPFHCVVFMRCNHCYQRWSITIPIYPYLTTPNKKFEGKSIL